MSPKTRAVVAFERLPSVGIDRSAAPAIFDQEARWRARVERSHEVVGVPTQRHTHASFFLLREVVGLPDIIERSQLDHQVMEAVGAGLDRSEAVMTAVQVEKESFERSQRVIAQ